MAARPPLRLVASKGGAIQLRDAAADLRARGTDLTYLECLMLMALFEAAIRSQLGSLKGGT
jgi:hypothetical protein